MFQQKYVSLFITLDNVAYVVPANSPGMCMLHFTVGFNAPWAGAIWFCIVDHFQNLDQVC